MAVCHVLIPQRICQVKNTPPRALEALPQMPISGELVDIGREWSGFPLSWSASWSILQTGQTTGRYPRCTSSTRLVRLDETGIAAFVDAAAVTLLGGKQ